MPNGAQNALAGYLYQFVGAAGLAARSMISDGQDSKENRTLFRRVYGSRIFHEIDDMDAVIALADGAGSVGVQFKYSPRTPPREIQQNELIEMLDYFYRSTKGSTKVRYIEFILITNRSFAPAASRLYQSRTEKTPSRVLAPNFGSLTKLSKSVKKLKLLYKSDADQVARSRHKILQKLELHLTSDYRNWADEVRKYAYIHGILPHEFDKALSDLTGLIQARTVNSTLELSSEELNRGLLGIPDALPLVPARNAVCVRNSAGRDCVQYMADSLGGNIGTLIRRRLLNIIDEKVRTHSLVFIHGEGGCGKSILAAQYLEQMSQVCFVVPIVASHVDAEWPGRVFNSWRSPSHSGQLLNETIMGILARIRQADKATPRPILLLDLDGIDEIENTQRQAARTLIGKFFVLGRVERLDATLLVTCRSEGRMSDGSFEHILSEWLAIDAPDAHLESVGRVDVGDFDRDELIEAAGVLGKEYGNRLGSLLSLVTDLPADPLFLSGEIHPDVAYPSSRPDFAESLQHPAMWRSFVAMDDPMRRRVLMQDSLALSELARRFLARFYRKVQTRRGALTRERTSEFLEAVCSSLPTDQPTYSLQGHWSPAAPCLMNHRETETLFDEAVSYGLLRVGERGRWWWRHGIVYDHLRGA
jgi:hypothetical protein